MWKRDYTFIWCRNGNELLQLPDYCFCSRATTLSVELALKCDETEAGRSENTLQSIKNYKLLANVKKNISLHKQFLHTFRDSIKKKKNPACGGLRKKSQQNSAGFFVWVTIKER